MAIHGALGSMIFFDLNHRNFFSKIFGLVSFDFSNVLLQNGIYELISKLIIIFAPGVIKNHFISKQLTLWTCFICISFSIPSILLCGGTKKIQKKTNINSLFKFFLNQTNYFRKRNFWETIFLL